MGVFEMKIGKKDLRKLLNKERNKVNDLEILMDEINRLVEENNQLRESNFDLLLQLEKFKNDQASS
jgi:heme oxygenase